MGSKKWKSMSYSQGGGAVVRRLRRLLRGEVEPDLGGRGLDGDAVPADAALAGHLVGAVVVPGDGVGGLLGHVPRERGDEDEPHHRRGEDQHEPPAEAAAGHQPVRLDRRDHRHVDRRQVPHHRVGHRHVNLQLPTRVPLPLPGAAAAATSGIDD